MLQHPDTNSGELKQARLRWRLFCNILLQPNILVCFLSTPACLKLTLSPRRKLSSTVLMRNTQINKLKMDMLLIALYSTALMLRRPPSHCGFAIRYWTKKRVSLNASGLTRWVNYASEETGGGGPLAMCAHKPIRRRVSQCPLAACPD